MANRLILFSLLFVIPLLGYGTGSQLQTSNRAEFRSTIRAENPMLNEAEVASITIERSCKKPSPLTQRICQKQTNLNLMRYGAVLAGMGGLTLLLGIRIAGWLAKVESTLLAGLFKPGLYLSVAVLFPLFTLHATIVLTAFHYGYSAMPFFMLCVIGLAVFGSLMFIARTAFKMIRKAQTHVAGRILADREAADLWILVTETSQRVGAVPPQHIVVGLEPGCFVTEAEVICQDGTFTERTFYCSLPLCRLLSVNELVSFISHEMRHFKGESKEISGRVYPLYRGTATSLAEQRAARRHPAWPLTTYPAIVFLTYYRDSFSEAVQRINRKREYRADQVAVRATSSKIFAAALVKSHYFTAQWEGLQKTATRALKQGKLPTNISTWIAGAMAQSIDFSTISRISGVSISHPTDIHPSLSRRLQRIQENITAIDAEACEVTPADAAIRLIPGVERLEQELSAAYLLKLASSVKIDDARQRDDQSPAETVQ